MNALTVAEIKSLKIGDRVTFPNGANSYPDFYFGDRLDGAISEIADDCAWVKLDDYKPELDEWRTGFKSGSGVTDKPINHARLGGTEHGPHNR